MNPQEKQQIVACDENGFHYLNELRLALPISGSLSLRKKKHFKTILDICPKVEGVDFTDVPDDDTTLAFLIELG
ncbi:hypothetical protein Tco_1231414 [Tanacetum coccineum]